LKPKQEGRMEIVRCRVMKVIDVGRNKMGGIPLISVHN